jgi:hypothetical protein
VVWTFSAEHSAEDDMSGLSVEEAELRQELAVRKLGEAMRHKSWVYFIECKGANAIKIGHSIDPKCRLEALQAGCPLKLSMVVRTCGGIQEEYDVHRRFRHLRIHGEWFRAEPELVDFILGLEDDGPIDTTPLWVEFSGARKDLEIAELRARLAQHEAAE